MSCLFLFITLTVAAYIFWEKWHWKLASVNNYLLSPSNWPLTFLGDMYCNLPPCHLLDNVIVESRSSLSVLCLELNVSVFMIMERSSSKYRVLTLFPKSILRLSSYLFIHIIFICKMMILLGNGALVSLLDSGQCTFLVCKYLANDEEWLAVISGLNQVLFLHQKHHKLPNCTISYLWHVNQIKSNQNHF